MHRIKGVEKHFWLLIAVWTGCVAVLAANEVVHQRKALYDLALSDARTHFNKDQAARLWLSAQGGAYIPLTDGVTPNPYLETVPERDVVTPSGKQLTLISSAHFIRKLMEHYQSIYGVAAHMTSLRNFRPETAPDEWERAALEQFEAGRDEVLAFADCSAGRCLRLMRPILTENSCLKCHQQDRVGDIRGGASVTVPLAPYEASWRRQFVSTLFGYGGLWLLGISGLTLAVRRLADSLARQKKAETSLRLVQDNYHVMVGNSLTGIYIVQDQVIRFANEEFARIHGYDLHEVVGMNPLDLVHPEERPRVAERMKKRLAGNSVSAEYRLRGLTRRGDSIWLLRRNTVTLYEGRPAILGNQIDITRQQMTQAELQSSQRQLQRLVDSLIELQEKQRNQFVTEIHENIAQSISVIKLYIESALQEIQSTSRDECTNLLPVIATVQQTVRDIRNLVSRYGPLNLNLIGIIATLGWLAREFERRCPAVAVRKDFRMEEEDIPEPLKMIIFRVAEQSLHELAAAGCPRSAMIRLAQKEGVIRLTIGGAVSAGRGMRTGSPAELVFLALQRRVEIYGGVLRCQAQSEQFEISAAWPRSCDVSIPSDELG